MTNDEFVDRRYGPAITLAAMVCALRSRGETRDKIIRAVRCSERRDDCDVELFGTCERIAQLAMDAWDKCQAGNS